MPDGTTNPDKQHRNPDKVPLSVVILTKNEEINIGDGLDGVGWADERIVFDSYSTDGTLEIARARGARIIQREFDNHATHKNWAIDNIDFKNEWVLLLDADERLTPGLEEEIRSRLADPEDLVGFHIPWRRFLWGREVRFSGRDYNLRLIKRGFCRYEQRLVHEHMVASGPTGHLSNYLLNKEERGFERYCERLNMYTSREAVEIYKMLHGTQSAGLAGAWFRRGPEGRRALKNFAYRHLPARPMIMFLYFYIFRLGFLNGAVGFRVCALKMFFDYVIKIKVEEMEDKQSPLYRTYAEYVDHEPKQSPGPVSRTSSASPQSVGSSAQP